MYFWINFSWSAQNPRGFFRNRPRGVSHIIYAYGSKATDERSTYPVSKVKMDHIFDVKYVFEVLQNISKNQNISENMNMFPISSCRKLIGFERVSTRAFQNRSKKWIISSLHQMRALFVQTVPKSKIPCGATNGILLTLTIKHCVAGILQHSHTPCGLVPNSTHKFHTCGRYITAVTGDRR